ncbi:ABC transporter permease [Gemmobacter sp. 24YEA27]|uniref:ABC transporter permease n=1 Tax=Gemmobacter sp. 24YEA27 TaxID=3040672 RepID=UPI0024B344BF|nr:ABC transporter permease [Gemmobacter sp. 24YEA27]
MSIATTPRHRGPAIIPQLIGNPLLWLLVLILALGLMTSPVFLSGNNIANVLRNAAVVGLLATGFSVVLLTGRIDLSIASVMVFSVIAGVLLTTEAGRYLGFRWMVRGNTFAGPEALAIGLCLASGALLGLLNGLGSVGLKITSFIFTLITMTALRGVSYLITNGAPVYYSEGLMRWLGEAVFFGLPVGFILFLAMAVLLHLTLSGTVFGRRLMAIGGNEKAARYSGINTGLIVIAAFVISGFCAALAGVLFTARLMSVEPALAQGYELIAITIAVIGGISLAGGTGSIPNVLLSAVTFSAGLNLLAIWGIATWYQNLAIGIALIATVILTRVLNKAKPS